MCLKDVKLKWQNLISLPCEGLELLMKNPNEGSPPPKDVKLKWQNLISLPCEGLELLMKNPNEGNLPPPGIDRAKTEANLKQWKH